MIEVLDIPLYDADMQNAVNNILHEISFSKKQNHCVSATGAHGIIYAKKNEDFKKILKDFYLNLPDGMPSVWVGRLKGAKQMQRCYGPDFFMATIIATKDKQINHFFCGGKEGVADELKQQCGVKFNNNNVVGTFCPPFRQMTTEEMLDLGKRINQSNADMVWIGLSTPKQEQFAWHLRQFVNTHFIITVGAAFDFHTSHVKQAPSWVQKIGMEWFFRLLNEPKRLFKRYMEIVPLFIFYNLKEFIQFRVQKK